jgi:hypothetical protein
LRREVVLDKGVRQICGGNVVLGQGAGTGKTRFLLAERITVDEDVKWGL